MAVGTRPEGVVPAGNLWAAVTFATRGEAVAVAREVRRSLRRRRVFVASVSRWGRGSWLVHKAAPAATA